MPRVIERTVFKFSELSDSAKETARDAYRLNNHHDEWWDYVYEDAVECGRLMGINIDTRPTKLHGGGVGFEPNIYFSGFSSQGDGACFTAGYSATDDDPVTAIMGHAGRDEKLKSIAKELALLQVTTRLKGCGTLNGVITSNSHRYSHSNTMDCSATYTGVNGDADHDVPEEVEEALRDLMRRFADWIYRQLEAEYEYLNSDGCIDEQLSNNGDEFDEDGSIV